MAKLSKRVRAINEKVEAGKVYQVTEALDLLKELSTVKFPETVDVAINLGIDPRKSDQVVRGATTLPNGSGKAVRVCVFAQGDAAEAAKAAGAEFVGMDELAEEVKGAIIQRRARKQIVEDDARENTITSWRAFECRVFQQRSSRAS